MVKLSTQYTFSPRNDQVNYGISTQGNIMKPPKIMLQMSLIWKATDDRLSEKSGH